MTEMRTDEIMTPPLGITDGKVTGELLMDMFSHFELYSKMRSRGEADDSLATPHELMQNLNDYFEGVVPNPTGHTRWRWSDYGIRVKVREITQGSIIINQSKKRYTEDMEGVAVTAEGIIARIGFDAPGFRVITDDDIELAVMPVDSFTGAHRVELEIISVGEEAQKL